MKFRTISNKRFLKLLLPLSHCSRDGRRFKYYVLLPEVPRDTPETNPLLKSSYLTNFKDLSRTHCVNAVGKLSLEYESSVCRLENDLQQGSVDKTISSILEPLERISSPLEFAWTTLITLNAVDTSLNLKSATAQLQRVMQRSKDRALVSEPVYHALKEVNADADRLTLDEQKIVKRRMAASEACGIMLSPAEKDRFKSVTSKLDQQMTNYRQRVEQQTNRFGHVLMNSSEVSRFPEELLRLTAKNGSRPEEGPWLITLHQPVYNLFMEHCPDRMQRWNIWRAHINRASHSSEGSNSVCIEEIRSGRRNLAKLLGFSSFAEMSLQSNMAGSVSNVQSVLNTLHVKNKPIVEDELLELQEFALQNDFKQELELWDVPYWRRLYRNEIYQVNEQEISEYFHLPVVLNGLFTFCHKLFGVTIKESSNPVSFWSEDVQFYEIFDENGDRLGCFCTDLYSRPGQKTATPSFVPARSRNNTAGMEPLSYLILNLPRPISSGLSTRLSFKDVVTLFRMFGYVLHHTLSKSPYSETSGVNNLEWDVVPTSSYFLGNFLYHYETFSTIFTHSSTGQAMPRDMHHNLIKRDRHMVAYDLSKELYLSAMDMQFHSKTDFWMDIMKTLWAEFVPFKLDKDNNHPCSFQEIFSGHMAASYYADIWAEMLAADMFSAFLEAGLRNETEFCSLGRRFRETFLAVGSSCSTTESFRKFRGRDPSVEALIDAYGMKTMKVKPDLHYVTK